MEMRRIRRVRLAVVLAVLIGIVSVATLPVSASGQMEFGIGVPISTSFGFSSLSYGLEAYGRFLLGALVWETALQTYRTFDSLYIRNTIATAASFFLALGHVTNLLPHFGSTYFTFGAGLAFGRAFVARFAVNLALSVGGGLYPFLEFRLQFGLDP
jgi:hypothetical protein